MDPPHDNKWARLKLILMSAPILALFGSSRTTKLLVDALKDGIGAVSVQLRNGSWRPVAYASRSLSDSKMRCAQIGKEAFELVYGCERLHHLSYGRHVILETGHSPFISCAIKEDSRRCTALSAVFLFEACAVWLYSSLYT